MSDYSYEREQNSIWSADDLTYMLFMLHVISSTIYHGFNHVNFAKKFGGQNE